MTSSYPEDSGNTESTADEPGDDSLPDELEGQFAPSPPATATEDPDMHTLTGTEDGEDDAVTSPGAG